MGYPYGHRKTTTLIADPRLNSMVAPMALDGPINGDRFEDYVGQILVPGIRSTPTDSLLEDWETAVRNTEASSHSYFFLPVWVVGYPTHEYLLLEKVAQSRDEFRRVPSAVRTGFLRPINFFDACLSPALVGGSNPRTSDGFVGG